MGKKKESNLASRMKEYYENISKTKLLRRTPAIVRVDGRAFHTFTRGMMRPFDMILVSAMQNTAKYLCENIPGCVFGYTQSDEISLVLVDYKELDSAAWFDYEVEKLTSIIAAMATKAFNRFFMTDVYDLAIKCGISDNEIMAATLFGDYPKTDDKQLLKYLKALHKGAEFDARCFNVPKEEVVNNIYWRQQDATRNSIQMVGRAHFSHKELHKKNTSDIQDMLHEKKGINWNNFPVHLKRGTAVIKDEAGKWFIDEEMPILKGVGREYLENLIYFD